MSLPKKTPVQWRLRFDFHGFDGGARPRFVLPGGDEAKSWDYLSQLIESAIETGFPPGRVATRTVIKPLIKGING